MYCNIPIYDHKEAQIKVHFEKALDFINTAVKNNTGVLVHCIAGVSRSSSCVIAYLMHYHRLRLIQAYAAVKRQRCIIQPNEGFRLQAR